MAKVILEDDTKSSADISDVNTLLKDIDDANGTYSNELQKETELTISLLSDEAKQELPTVFIHDKSILTFLIEDGALFLIPDFIEANPALVKTPDRDGKLPILHLAEFGEYDLLSEFIEAGANPYTKDRNGRSMVWYAVAGQQALFIDKLFQEYPRVVQTALNSKNYMGIMRNASKWQIHYSTKGIPGVMSAEDYLKAIMANANTKQDQWLLSKVDVPMSKEEFEEYIKVWFDNSNGDIDSSILTTALDKLDLNVVTTTDNSTFTITKKGTGGSTEEPETKPEPDRTVTTKEGKTRTKLEDLEAGDVFDTNDFLEWSGQYNVWELQIFLTDNDFSLEDDIKAKTMTIQGTIKKKDTVPVPDLDTLGQLQVEEKISQDEFVALVKSIAKKEGVSEYKAYMDYVKPILSDQEITLTKGKFTGVMKVIPSTKSKVDKAINSFKEPMSKEINKAFKSIMSPAINKAFRASKQEDYMNTLIEDAEFPFYSKTDEDESPEISEESLEDLWTKVHKSSGRLNPELAEEAQSILEALPKEEKQKLSSIYIDEVSLISFLVLEEANELIPIIIKANPDTAKTLDKNGNTPLIHLARKGEFYDVPALIQAGADPYVPATEGKHLGMFGEAVAHHQTDFIQDLYRDFPQVIYAEIKSPKREFMITKLSSTWDSESGLIQAVNAQGKHIGFSPKRFVSALMDKLKVKYGDALDVPNLKQPSVEDKPESENKSTLDSEKTPKPKPESTPDSEDTYAPQSITDLKSGDTLSASELTAIISRIAKTKSLSFKQAWETIGKWYLTNKKLEIVMDASGKSYKVQPLTVPKTINKAFRTT